MRLLLGTAPVLDVAREGEDDIGSRVAAVWEKCLVRVCPGFEIERRGARAGVGGAVSKLAQVADVDVGIAIEVAAEALESLHVA